MPQARVWVVGIDPAAADGKMVPQPGLPRAVGHGAKTSGLTVAPPSLFWEVSRTRAAPRMIGSGLGADTCTSLADEAMGNEAAQFHHVSRRRHGMDIHSACPKTATRNRRSERSCETNRVF